MKQKIRSNIAPIILCIVVGFQMYLSIFDNLTPWKGGGFGMFSTIDTPGTRNLRAFVFINNKEYPVMFPRSFRGEVDKIRAFPKKENILDFSKKLFNKKWTPIDTQQKSVTSEPSLASVYDIYNNTNQNTNSNYDMPLYYNSKYAILSEESPNKQGFLPQKYKMQLWKTSFSDGKIINTLVLSVNLKR